MPGMLSQIEKRLEDKKSEVAGIAKPWSSDLPAKDEAPKPSRKPTVVKTRGAPPPGFKNGTPTPPAEPTQPEKGSKVMGARVGPRLYAALETFRKERGITSLREALTIAAEERLGLR